MYDPENIFAKIIKKELKCDIVYEDQEILAFKDINPIANTHILVIPKGEYISFDDFVVNYNNINDFFLKVHKIAKKNNLCNSGYRIITNIGEDAHQIIKHFHIHIIGGNVLCNI